MIALYALQYWKLAVAVVLVGLLGVQSCRLKDAQADLAACEAGQSVFEAEMVAQHARGVAEGVKAQQEAQAALDARRANMAAEKVRQAEGRAKAAEARAARLLKAISDAKAECLHEPLDEAVLEEFRQ